MMEGISKKINPIKVRYKELADGSKSIYLDYKVEGKRKVEYLKMYLLPGRSEEVKRMNDHTRRAVANIIAQRMENLAWDKEVNAGVEASKRLLTDVCAEYRDLRLKKGIKSAKCQYSQLVKYINKVNANIRMWEINLDFVKALADCMMKVVHVSTGKPLAQKTIMDIITSLSSAMIYARKKGMVKENPVDLFDKSSIQGSFCKRNYLIASEIKSLAETPCSNEAYKNLFLFACFVGLRYTDLRTLRWKDVIIENGETRIEKMMSKTRHMVYVPLGKVALRYLPPRRDFDELVFPNLPGTIPKVDAVIREWVKNAGIEKEVTFYTSRHTFATLNLTQGADLFVVSQLMGHRNIRMTEGYAEIIDAKKVADVMLIDNMFAEYRKKENIPEGDNKECNGLLNQGWELKRPISDVIDIAYYYFNGLTTSDLSYNYNLLKSYFKQFDEKIRLCDITRQKTVDFVNFLQDGAIDEHGRRLCHMKVLEALQTLEDTFRVAIKRNWMQYNYLSDIDWRIIKGRIDPREDLTDDELDILDATPCDVPAIKEVFLLCCFCNLTHEEAFSLKWSDISITEAGRMQMSIFRKKSSTHCTMLIPKRAERYLPERDENDHLVFKAEKTSLSYINDVFRIWTRSSILERRITFSRYKATNMRIFAERRSMKRDGK